MVDRGDPQAEDRGPPVSAEFDAFEGSYLDDVDEAVGFSGKPGSFYIRRKADLLIELASRHFGDPGSVSMLDVGCGTGQTDGFLAGRVGSLSGVDVSRTSLDRAREKNRDVRYEAFEEGSPIPFDDGTFDVAFAICVMHHVPAVAQAGFLAEMRRVTQPGGIVAIFEHNPWNPGTRKAVRDCAFDEHVTLIRQRRIEGMLTDAGLDPVEARQIIFLPTAAPAWLRIERRIGWLPLGAQYLVAARRGAQLPGPSATSS